MIYKCCIFAVSKLFKDEKAPCYAKAQSVLETLPFA